MTQRSVCTETLGAQVGTTIDALDTPSLVIDIALVESNIKELMKRLSASNPAVSVRPHLKTGKCPEIARMLLDCGAKGICVAKISEAEIFTEAGIRDILVTTEIVGMPKLERFLRLYRRNPELKIVVDNQRVATELSVLASGYSLNEPINVLIDLNVGQNRTGVNSAEEALRLAQAIEELQHLQVIGVQGYEGHLQHLPEAQRQTECRAAMSKLSEAVLLLRSQGFEVPIVTTGGTGTAEICATCANVTEVQPGSFIFMDVAYRKATGGKFANALSVLSTVISKPSSHRVVVDAGLKSLSIDMGNAEPKDMPDFTYRPAGDEHGVIESKSGAEVTLAVGEKIELLPGHIDTTVALFDQYCVTRGGQVEAVWPIAARGKVQ